MIASDVVAFYDRCEATGIWIDGGWSVDALLGEETRPHADLDIAIETRHLPVLHQLLEADGYALVPRDDTTDWNFVLGDTHGRRIDIHAFVFNETGAGILGPPENNHAYPPGSLTGRGKILNREVRCIAPEHLVRFHIGYEPRETDRHDVKLLCERFNIPPPAEYL
ncbi:MAG: tRNA nucleotidyltransferase [Alphaproteobacteria bacterium]|jgi:lincosamide nucleotidyltransferase A/C/D/E|nr:MAG: tRNA nucleotidyltransferase [Alphaproteobacteria bacterium]